MKHRSLIAVLVNVHVLILVMAVGVLCLSGCASGHMELKELAPLPVGVYDIELAQDALPQELVGQWQRLRDGLIIDVLNTAALRQQQTGAYRVQENIVCLRLGHTVASYAQSLCGLPSSGQRDRQQMADKAWRREAINPVTLMVLSWRLADEWPWPWVDGAHLYGGLSGLCAHYNGKAQAYVFDREQGVYVDHFAQPIIIADVGGEIPAVGEQQTAAMRVQLALGDIIASEDSVSGLARYGILVEDRGRQGFLDPEDILVSAFVPPEKEPTMIAQWQLGFLMGAGGVHVYRRDQLRAKSIRSRYQPDNPIWTLEPRRQWMVLAGMIIIIMLLFRRGRKLRGKR